MSQQCSACAHYCDSNGECHRYPPVPIVVFWDNGGRETRFASPWVSSSHRCGEFKQAATTMAMDNINNCVLLSHEEWARVCSLVQRDYGWSSDLLIEAVRTGILPAFKVGSGSTSLPPYWKRSS